MVHGAKDSFRYGFAILSESAVQRRDYEIERGAYLGRVVETPVLENIDLDPLEDGDVAQFGVGAVDLIVLILDVVTEQSTSVCGRLAVIRDSYVFVPRVSRSNRPVANSAGSVRVVTVTVDEPA